MPPRIQASWLNCHRAFTAAQKCIKRDNGCGSAVRNSHLTSKPKSKTIFSGIQPTGVPHLGNYLGALRQWVNHQNEAEESTRLIFSLVDLHAITIRQDAGLLRQWKKESLAMLLAIGLNPQRSILFYQSDVPAHSELMWILSCQASTGYLSRMTQWKDKTANDKANSEKLKLGLFSYPVLQAADILLYQTTHVPVGHDQAQHLEFARELAVGFNHSFGNVFVPPETLVSPAKRIMSLTDPKLKMSKSHANAKSRILLTDSEEIIRSKLKSAITDSIDGVSYDPEKRPGVSNLIDIIYHSTKSGSAADSNAGEDLLSLAKEMDGLSLRVVKERAAEAVNQLINPIRERYTDIMQREDHLAQIAAEGAEKANQQAVTTLSLVKQAAGLL